MASKLIAILIVILVSKDNCIFRFFPRIHIEAARQGLLILFNTVLLGIHFKTMPFLSDNQNKAEMWARSVQVAIASLGIFIALKIGPSTVILTAIIAVSIIGIFLVLYYTLKNSSYWNKLLKRARSKLEFSPEIAHCDPGQVDWDRELCKRIWQETWTGLFLLADEFRLPENARMSFFESPSKPPYLLDFNGSVAERHLENLKIVRFIGIREYFSTISQTNSRLETLRRTIMNEFVGVDMYYRITYETDRVKSFFGKSFVIPFPFQVVLVYDEDEQVQHAFKEEEELEDYVRQNLDTAVQKKRQLRRKLRALEGQEIILPTVLVKKFNFRYGRISINYSSDTIWQQQYNMSAGFKVTFSTRQNIDISLTQHRGSSITGQHFEASELGVTHDFLYTPELEALFEVNQKIISERIGFIVQIMEEYRTFYANQVLWKTETMSYSFFTQIYNDSSLSDDQLMAKLIELEKNPALKDIPRLHGATLACLKNRMQLAERSVVHQAWYVFWDDMYRLNWETCYPLRDYIQDFSPAWQSSICYRPMPREKLERWLQKREILGRFMHNGHVNRLYAILQQKTFGEHIPVGARLREEWESKREARMSEWKFG